ncbi:MAG: SMP-30/gluconolactonase/LRE family protein [Pseudomonas sp.]
MFSPPTEYNVEKLAEGLFHGKSTRWRAGKLYVSDMIGEKVYCIDAAGSKTVIAQLPHKPNGMGFLPNGDLILSSMLENKLFRYLPDAPVGNNLELYADLSSLFTGYIGDMVIDDNGRIYVNDVGARVFEGEALKPGRIVIVEPDRTFSVGLENCHFPNGIAITPDKKRLVFAETFLEQLSTVDIVDGQLVNRRILLDMTKIFASEEDRTYKRGCVEGITVDAEGGIWLSVLQAEQYVRVDSEGHVTDRVHLPGHKVVACTLGGKDGKTLFMSASKIKGNYKSIFEALVARDIEATIFTARVAVGSGRP